MGSDTPLLDELDQNSFKRAYELSGDLKYALHRRRELGRPIYRAHGCRVTGKRWSSAAEDPVTD